MNADIVDLRDFYASPLGMVAAKTISLGLAPVWRNIPEERLVGIGYTLPYLDRFAPSCERALAFMPAAQGAVNWPVTGASLTALVADEELPLGDASVDRVLMVHALEFAENPQAVLTEVWRVLAPGGRLIIVVPNRRGVWARFEHTPFGSGRPWSRGQLVRLLRDSMFTPSAWADALLLPPFRRRSLLKLAMPLERLGRQLWPVFSGVVIIEATKQVYRGIPVLSARRERQRRAKPVLVPAGATARR
ncbi:class I SAM-dependent methyltransferase [Mangrovicella endophytica]|uniref:class I SAM-dependent methyltransferase n=1 Tax=Mangrovicella endophytica TaxID=2066697 RepID=UPI000C9E18CC|nr:class I SAM-dependent methyltransferase [Mangrovicella endophytica]